MEHSDLGCIKRGTVSYEYYWLDRCYNVFRFIEPDGDFRNYYCNINMPPTFADAVLDYVDLDIDVVVDREWQIKVLDVDEFENNVWLFSIPKTVGETAKQALDELILSIQTRRFPFDQT